jgi:GNAT superfamily N-acetyltransferase
MEYRAATRHDAWHVARLLIQLYEVEAPGMLTGDLEFSALIVRRALEHNDCSALLGAYYLQTLDDRPTGIGAVATAESPRRALWYPNLPTDARRLLGVRSGRAFVRGLKKLMGALVNPIREHEAMLHSIVIDRDVRRHGIGAHLLRVLEEEAGRREKVSSVLYVLNGNPAEQFYERFGYHTIRVTDGSRWGKKAAYPSIAMRKPLLRRAPSVLARASR